MTVVNVLMALAAWIVIALPLVIAMERAEARDE